MPESSVLLIFRGAHKSHSSTSYRRNKGRLVDTEACKEALVDKARMGPPRGVPAGIND
jgi:hypothetical protein